MPASRPHHSKHFMVESVVSLFAWMKLEKLKYSIQRTDSRDHWENHSKSKQRMKPLMIAKSYADLKRNTNRKSSRIVCSFAKVMLERVGEVAYKLELPEELSRVHNTFHVAFDLLRDALSAIFGIISLKVGVCDDGGGGGGCGISFCDDDADMFSLGV
ncbi:hypothetical protein Tco_1021613 [Tanacetum coccineum]